MWCATTTPDHVTTSKTATIIKWTETKTTTAETTGHCTHSYYNRTNKRCFIVPFVIYCHIRNDRLIATINWPHCSNKMVV